MKWKIVSQLRMELQFRGKGRVRERRYKWLERRYRLLRKLRLRFLGKDAN